jgi:hypothetical protein|nr:hypothetical protein [Phenylobacterium sp.]
MAWGRSAQQRGGELDDIGNWMVQRNADIALRQEADAVGRDLWDQATRSGQDLGAAQPSDLTAIGTNALNQGAMQATRLTSVGDTISGDDGAEPAARQTTSDAAFGDPPQASPGDLAPATPSYWLATARPGDSISRLTGTSDPGAIGRFVRLNSLDGRTSILRVGGSYAVPTRFDDASPDEIAVGRHLLQSDNAKLSALQPSTANDDGAGDHFATLVNAGINPWTGRYVRPAPPVAHANAVSAPTSLDRNLLAKTLAGNVALKVGQVVGLARGGLHTTQDLVGGAGFALRLLNPADPFFSPPGEAAWDQVIGAGDRFVGYAKKAISDPAAVGKDIRDELQRENIDLNPYATPMADTFPAELRRNFHIGANQGKAAFDVGSLFVGGEFAKGLALTRAVEAADAAKYAELGLNPKVIGHLDMPYEGMGHHSIVPRRFTFQRPIDGLTLPRWIPDRSLPKAVTDSAFNVSKPGGITRGQMYAYHYRVDPKFHGARLPDGSGGGWSGKKLGLQKYGLAERLWYSAPDALRAPIGEAVAAGAAADIFQNDWDRP